eukprot:540687-Pyramimonas_sp.AAC.1
MVAGTTYTPPAAGSNHTISAKSDGMALACGSNSRGQCDLPPLAADQTYTQVTAGANHAILLKSDGVAGACGDN